MVIRHVDATPAPRAGRSQECYWESRGLCVTAEAVGMFLSGVYTQTRPGWCVLYTYVHRSRLLLLRGHRQLHLGQVDADLGSTVVT